MLQRGRVEIVLAVILLIGAMWVVKGRFRDGPSGTTRPMQEERERRRLKSLGYLN